VHIGLCPFCLKKFEPIWDCNLVPYLYCYHSWCLLTHFSDSTMCIADGCELEPCDEWKVAVGLTKPVLKTGTTPNSKWEIYPSSGDFLVPRGVLFISLPWISVWFMFESPPPGQTRGLYLVLESCCWFC
jgi:hypothetical protein